MNAALGSWLVALGSWRQARQAAARGVVGLAVVIAAVAGPVAQLLRIEEIAAPRTASGQPEAPQYRIVWAEGWRPETKSQEPRAKSQEPKAKSPEPKPLRLLKPLADHWEAAARVQLDGADLPAPVAPAPMWDSEEPYAPETATPVYLSYQPPNPPARGPPASAF